MDCPHSWLPYEPSFRDILGATSNYICCCDKLDVSLNVLPYIGNGFIATQPHSPWIFMDGLFNGCRTESHRACIPSPLHWTLVPFKVDEQCLSSFKQTNWMHFGMGVYMEQLRFANGLIVCCTTFISRDRPGLFFRFVESDFNATDDTVQETIALNVDFRSHFPTESPDCDIEVSQSADCMHLSGSTHIIETEEFQQNPGRFYLCTNVFPAELEKGFVLTRSHPARYFLVSLSRSSMDEAKQEYDKVLDVVLYHPIQLLHEQAESWRTLWLEGCVVFTSSNDQSPDFTNINELTLPKVVQAAQYNLLTCVPKRLYPPILPCDEGFYDFFGLCPTGLSRGNDEDDYMGHVFWDMELWMLPWFAIFHPNSCRLALDYRYTKLPAARYQAIMEGLDGARFPWESAFSGIETTPWDLAAKNQLHVIGAVSQAVQQWLLLNLPDCRCSKEKFSRDHSSIPALGDDEQNKEELLPPRDSQLFQCNLRWYTECGRILLEEIARFWSHRMRYNEHKNGYEILDVMPPDEYTHCCRNSAYTNAIASISLKAPARFARRHSSTFDFPLMNEEYLFWESQADQLWMPFDEENGIMLEHEDYSLGTCVKQADVVLLQYPLMFDDNFKGQASDWRQRTLDYYASVTDLDGPAMTWSIFSICAMELNDFAKADEYFSRNLNHVQLPYYSWTETRDGSGAANFLTGAGGFLQAIVNGYFGIRVQLIDHHMIDADCPVGSHEVSVLFIHPKRSIPCGVPDETLPFNPRLVGIHFQLRRLELQLNSTQRLMCVKLLDGNALKVYVKEENQDLWKHFRSLTTGTGTMELSFQHICLTI